MAQVGMERSDQRRGVNNVSQEVGLSRVWSCATLVACTHKGDQVLYCD